jgi:hypothetical protein
MSDWLYVVGQVALLAFGLLCVFSPQRVVALVYPPARSKRLQWLEMLLVLTGFFLAFSAGARLYGAWQGYGAL